jgi:hypothetical protein
MVWDDPWTVFNDSFDVVVVIAITKDDACAMGSSGWVNGDALGDRRHGKSECITSAVADISVETTGRIWQCCFMYIDEL